MRTRPLIKRAPVDARALAFFQREFSQIRPDPYCKGGYRYRAMTRYSCEHEIERLPVVPLFQSAEYNPVPGYGGQERDYPDLTGSLPDSEEIRLVIRQWLSLIDEAVQTVSVHQIRTRAPGMPVPEGRHRDGNDWVGILVVHRVNLRADSGRTRVWSDTDELLVDEVLPEGVLVSFDDRLTTHDTSGIVEAASGEAYRDVFVFSTPDHSHYLPADSPHLRSRTSIVEESHAQRQ